jgi:hypothetical protein
VIKIKVTDEMVQAAFDFVKDEPGFAGTEEMKRVLEAALDIVERDLNKVSSDDVFGYWTIDPDVTTGTCIEVTP